MFLSSCDIFMKKSSKIKFWNSKIKFTNQSQWIISEKKNERMQCIFRCVVTILATNKFVYENNFKSMLNLLTILQFNDVYVITQRRQIEKFSQRRRDKFFNATWIVNEKKILKHEKKLYVFKNKIVKTKLFRHYHDDELIEHYNYKKIIELLNRKYYWSNMISYVKKYVNNCDIC